MTATRDHEVSVLEIPPSIVREIAQSRPEDGDFRERFRVEQPDVVELIAEQLGVEDDDEETIAAEFAHRVAAALWAMYVRAIDAGLPRLQREQVQTFVPIARELLGRLTHAHEDEVFDAERLAELPRGAQPHVMGFLIGALRASRLRMTGAEIFDTAALLFAIAGALESTVALKQ